MTTLNCEKCNHTGLLPFRNKEGKLIPNTFIDCDCKPFDVSPYPFRYTPDMFDFPMSYDFYRSLCREHGWQDPGSDKGVEQVSPPEEKPFTKTQWDSIGQLRTMNLHLQKKLLEHINSSSKDRGLY